MLNKEIEILKQYNDLKEQLEVWGKYVDAQIVDLLKTSEIAQQIKIYPKCRLKDDKSFISKALWRGKNYIAPLIKIEDKIATRVVLLKSDEIEPCAKILLESSIWRAEISKPLKGGIEGKPKEFDYQSLHIVVKPNEDDKRFKKEDIEALTCEIQIRTLLQHAFAEISHDSTYKGPYKNDVEMIRSLSKSMALMEATDDYFIRIFEMMTSQTKTFACYISELTRIYSLYKTTYKKEDLDVELTDLIFSLLVLKNVEIGDLEELCIKNEETIKDAVENNNELIFQQPIILLVYHYIVNSPEFIKQNWPLSQETLQSTFNGFGYSLI
jgi:putative GTP pyrophosphokinase